VTEHAEEQACSATPAVANGMAAGMEALHAAVKAELGEDGLPMVGGAEVSAAEHGCGWSVSMMKAEVKTEISVDLRETLVNVEIKSETSRPSRVARPPGMAAQGLAEEMADEGGGRRVQPKRGVKRRAVSSGEMAPRRRRKAAPVTQVTPQGVRWLAPPEEEIDRSGEEAPSAAAGARGRSPAAQSRYPGGGRRPNDDAWEAQLAKLKAYKRRHGGCNVPQRWAEDRELGTWVKKQRQCKKALDRGEPSDAMTAARMAKLDALGFTWELSAVERGKQNSKGRRDDAGWERWLARLKAYKRRHGDCNVPELWTTNPALGSWVSKQRQRKKALDRGAPSEGMTVTRAAKLEALGFVWELSTEGCRKQCIWDRGKECIWEAQLAKLTSYKQRHGDCNVPKGWAEDPVLARWVVYQRRGKRLLDCCEPSRATRGMTAARVAKLEAVGFAWELSAEELGKQYSKGALNDAGWEVQLAKIKVYKRSHGDCNVPRNWAEDPTLGIWVKDQRQSKKKLDRGDPRARFTAARAAKLAKLGFAWRIYGVRT
jgi:hypothetical protein